MLIKDFNKIAISLCKKVGPKEFISLSAKDLMYCCSVWQEKFVNDPRVPISYSPAFRKYYLMVEKEMHAIFGISACLQCGVQWPSDLVYEWGETIERELAFDPCHKKNSNRTIPDEFTTDEWWKKRGL